MHDLETKTPEELVQLLVRSASAAATMRAHDPGSFSTPFERAEQENLEAEIIRRMTRKDGPTPPPCDREIMEKGEQVYVERRGMSSNRMEGWVKKVAERSGQRVDWHYFGGIPVVLALGDIEAVKRAVKELMPELDKLYQEHAAEFGL